MVLNRNAAMCGLRLVGVLLAALTQTAHAGRLVSWGNDLPYHELSLKPAGDHFVALAGGVGVVTALRSDGSLVSWGDGYPTNPAHRYDTPAGSDFVAVASGVAASIAMRADGSLVAWGSDHSGLVSDTPAGPGFSMASFGDHVGMALHADGSIVGWGHAPSGELDIPAGNDFVAVDAGTYAMVALRSDGTVVSWSDCGQAPTGSDFVAVAAGLRECFAVRADGRLITWGEDEEYWQPWMPDATGFTHVEVATAFGSTAAAITSEGHIVIIGNPSDLWNITSDAPTGPGFTQVTFSTSGAIAIQAIPEPTTCALLLFGLGGMAAWARRRR